MLRHTWACRCKEAYGIKVWKRIYLSGTWTTPWLWCKSLGKFLYLHDVEYDHVEDHFVPVFFFLSNLVLSLQLVEKLSAKAADGPIKRKILSTIAEEHNIKWEPKSFGDNDTKTSQDLLVWFFYSGFSQCILIKKCYYSLSFWHYLYVKVGPSTLEKPAYEEPFQVLPPVHDEKRPPNSHATSHPKPMHDAWCTYEFIRAECNCCC